MEVLVHFEIDVRDLPTRYRLLKLRAPDALLVEDLLAADLPRDWFEQTDRTRTIGDRWLHASRSVLRRVPSAVVPETFNVLLNASKRSIICWCNIVPNEVYFVSTTVISAVLATRDKSTIKQAKRVIEDLTVASEANQFSKAFERLTAPRTVEARSETLELVLLDLEMPDVSVEDVVARARAAAQDVSTLILASSGEEAQRALNAGAYDYILKPIRVDDLATRLQIIIRDRLKTRPAYSAIDAPLPHLVERLHDAESGQLDARKVADFFGLSVAEFARLLGRGVSTVHKTPTSVTLQGRLIPFAAMASGLLRLTGSFKRARMWLNASDPALDGHAPIELLRKRRSTELAAYIQDLLEGRPA